MIVLMNRVLIVGPKPISAEVIKTLHKMGRLHISQIKPEGTTGISELSPEEMDKKHLLERLKQEIEGLLTLLEFRGAPAKAVQTPEWEKVLADVLVQRAEVNELVKQKLNLSDELALIENYRSAFEALSPLMSKLENSQKIKAFGFLAKISESSALDALQRELKKMTEGRVEFYRHQVAENKIAVLAAFHINDEEKIRNLFTKAGVNELKLPSTVDSLGMAEAVPQLKDKSRGLPIKISETANRILNISNQEGPLYEAYRLLIKDEMVRLQAKEELPEGRFTFYLQGYLPAEDLPSLKEMLFKKFGDKVTIQVIEINHHDAPNVPVLLKNHKIIKPFELALSIFNPPQYGTVDPTPFIAFFFPLFFGFIVGDIGYGVVMLLAVALLRLKFKSNQIVKNLTTIFAICAVWTTIFGVVFGELFGDLGEHMHWIKPMSEKLNRLTPDSIMTLFWAAVILGIIQVFIGFGIMFYQGIKHKDLHHILEPIAFTLGIAGVAGFAASWMFHAISASYLIPSIALFVVGAGLLGWLVGVAGPIEVFGVVGNILSFARLFAIGLSAAYLAYSANLISRMVSAGGGAVNIGLGIITALVLHTLFFSLGLISPIMQPFRLQVVEFFTKFKYHDYSGKKYKPLKTLGGK